MTQATLVDLATFAVSVGLLWKGANWVVTSAARTAQRFQISDVVIGMTIVAVGTSIPEVMVTMVAAFGGHDDISVSNVVGSNIFNIGIILGGCALVRTMPTNRKLVYHDALMLLGAGLLLIVLLRINFGHLARPAGLLMLGVLAAYIIYLLKRKEEPDELSSDAQVQLATWRDIPLFLFGVASVVVGARLLVGAAVDLAGDFGIGEWAIGVTLVAMGTSLPELAVCVAAILKNRPGILIGNLVGSDLFNVLGVLGFTAVLHPLQISTSEATSLSLYYMGAMTLVLVIFMRSGWRLSRIEGLALVAMALFRWHHDLNLSP